MDPEQPQENPQENPTDNRPDEDDWDILSPGFWDRYDTEETE